MAISIATLTNGTVNTGVDATSFATGSITWAGQVGLAIVVSSTNAGTPGTPSASGWTLVTNAQSAGGSQTISLMYNLTPSTGAITWDFAGVSQRYFMCSVCAVTGADNTQAPINGVSLTAASQTTASITYSRTSASNGNFAGVWHFANEASAASSGFTELDDMNGAYEQNVGMCSDWRADAVTGATATATWSTSSNVRAVACEIIIASTAKTHQLVDAGLINRGLINAGLVGRF